MHPTASPDAQVAKFSRIPVLDYSLISPPSTKPLFISQLQHALINVGFLYLSNHTVPASTIDPLLDYIPKLFALPQEEKEQIQIFNSPHFVGYSGLDAGLTSGKVDHKEQFEFRTKHQTSWRKREEEYWKLWGPSQVRLVCVSLVHKRFPFLSTPVARRICPTWLPCRPRTLPGPSLRPRVHLHLPPGRILLYPSTRWTNSTTRRKTCGTASKS